MLVPLSTYSLDRFVPIAASFSEKMDSDLDGMVWCLCNGSTELTLSFSCSDATGKQFGSLLGPTDCFPGNWPGLTDNDNGGKTLYFRWGRFISNTFQSPPFVFFGQIFQLWNDFGGLNSGFGYPLADPQILPDGSICSIFEGGHIHQTGTNDAEV